MKETTVKDIGSKLCKAFCLQKMPLAIYGAAEVPEEVVHLADVHRCLAVAMHRIAGEATIPGFYLAAEEPEGCCIGGLTHVGFTPRPEYIRYFVSTGKADVRGGAAEYLKADPKLVDRCVAALGEVQPPGRFLVVQRCDAFAGYAEGIRAIACFGNAEQIRNLAALVHFDRDDPFSPVIVPWGPACGTLITYPAGLARNAPGDTAFLGPQDPTLNWALPPDAMAVGLPIALAVRMVHNIDRSFVALRPRVAFPNHPPS
jgi:hypothetical protein